ncbi:uncharacterized protein L3040_000969 [Drepanopeziza brunnea f. sp. 'multigermtubi']|uniref:uncharacterized protein n=1 Tax=Drepanopeziza brunnea f. sp. 'multigermtubi' TaxID=698441 RepID=UPI00238ADECE|nr:hypothetical protein L3040_000969 [Drepanopeziza brunnea f. sp. 'multigermtubi']
MNAASIFGEDIDEKMTGFDTSGYGCEFFVSSKCHTADEYFVYRGTIGDVLSGDNAFSNDAVSSFRCET